MFQTPFTRAKNPNVCQISILGEGPSSTIDPSVPGDIWFDIILRARGPAAANRIAVVGNGNAPAFPSFAPIPTQPAELSAVPPPGMFEIFPDDLFIDTLMDDQSLGTVEASPE